MLGDAILDAELIGASGSDGEPGVELVVMAVVARARGESVSMLISPVDIEGDELAPLMLRRSS